LTVSDQSEIPTADAVEVFVASLRQRSVPINTIKSYAHDLRLFVRAVSADLSAVTPETIEVFLEGSGQLSPATRRRRYSTLCTFYRWLIRHAIIEINPMERLEAIEPVEREPRPLQPETVTKILQAIPASNLRDRALFTLLYETGIRVGEALGLLATEVDLTQDDEKIRVFGKGQRERTVMLTAAPESIRLLRRHLKQSRITSGSVFRGDPRYGGSPLPLEYSVVHYAWQKYCKTAGVEATIHQLRHSRASQLLQAGVPVTTVRKQLGHRNIQSTLLYAEVDQATIKQDLQHYQRRKGRQR
jgi:integrase/recombinase XerD